VAYIAVARTGKRDPHVVSKSFKGLRVRVLLGQAFVERDVITEDSRGLRARVYLRVGSGS
jgi:hypothetical protein